MLLNNPIALWSLAGLLVPVLIHLLSRREGRTIAIGSLRNLRESPTARFRHVRLNELTLLALRCLLVLWLAMILARLQWPESVDRTTRKWAIIEKGIENEPAAQRLLDSLEENGFDQRLLAAGFPLATEKTTAEAPGDYWRLAEDLQKLPVDSVVVIAFNYLERFNGLRIPLPVHVNWIGIDGGRDEFIAEDIRVNSDSSWVRKGFTSGMATHYTTEKGRSPSATLPQEITVGLYSSGEFALDAKIVLAALKAVQSVTPHRLLITDAPADAWASGKEEWVFWLSESPFPGKGHPKSIAYGPCAGKHSHVLVPSPRAGTLCDGTSGAEWIITKRLNEDVALDEGLTGQLANLLIPQTAKVVLDRRVLPDPMIWYGLGTEARSQSRIPAEPHLVVLLLITLFVERWLAFKKRQ